MPDLEEEFWGSKPSKTNSWMVDGNVKYFLTVLFCAASFLWFGFKLAFFIPLGITEARPIDQAPHEQPAPVEEDENIVVLVTGSDKNKNDAGRADTLMLAFLDTEKKSVNVLSIPRDTYVSIPNRGRTKINHAYAYGGISLAKETVEDFLGVSVDNYVDIDFQGFISLVDALGGVEYDVEKRMYYPEENINLKAGPQLLDGEDALGYVRYRSDGMGDIGRVNRQLDFLRVLADRVLSLSTLWKIPKLVGIFQDNVETDFNLGEMLLLANKFKSIDTSQLKTQMLPGEAKYIDGVSYWITDSDEVQQVVDQLTGKVPEETEEEQEEQSEGS
ncbi:MAG: LCP family protein [Bacillota bacterium]|jgi:LCP family protein required for cell wall assembly|nr:LCP family protein [Clostridia bacterium]